jgi:hypothetical protein
MALAACLVSQGVIAQQQQSQPAIQLPVAVDGSVTPGQIPDNLAYQHFFAAIAAHPFPSQQEAARQSAQLSPSASRLRTGKH